MQWRDPDSGTVHSIYPTSEFITEQTSYYERECQHETSELRFAKDAGGATHLRKQCVACGALIGLSLSRSQANPNTPLADQGLHPAYIAKRKKELEALYRKHISIQLRDRTSWKAQYAQYLQTPLWHAKRKKVLDRAKGVCEGCGEKRATQVHHLTYAHLGAELLFELVAVCDDCHAICHIDENVEDEELE